MKSVLFGALIGACSLFSASSFAEIIQADLYEDNDARLVYDSETNLQWLDLTETAGMNISEVRYEMNGGRFDGWRFASRAESRLLLSHIFPSYSITGADYINTVRSESDLFVDLFGDMSDQARVVSPDYMSMGVVIDGPGWYLFGRYRSGMPRLYLATDNIANETDQVESHYGYGFMLVSDNADTYSLNNGEYNTYKDVPVWSIGLGSLALLGFRRKKKGV